MMHSPTPRNISSTAWQRPTENVPTADSATYSGFAYAAYDGNELTGAANLTADFTSKSITGSTTMTGTGTDSATVDFDGDITGNTFAGDATLTAITGSFASDFTVTPRKPTLERRDFRSQLQRGNRNFGIDNTAGDDELRGGFITVRDYEEKP